MRKFAKTLLWVILIPTILFAIFLLYSTIFEYKPVAKITVYSDALPDTLTDNLVYSAMIWNIGYSGLGANMDFFYDGGVQVRDSRENVEANLKNIADFIEGNDSLDFILLQEVDLQSKRSYRINQLVEFDSLLSQHIGFTGINYNVGFVPLPLTAPMGKVYSGIVTYSRYSPACAERHAFQGNYSWPTSTFMLKRCFLVSRFLLPSGKEFILINTHNSAYDDGSLRAAQLKQLAAFVQHEFENGNYVLIGGDWNQSPAGFEPNFGQVFDTLNVSYLPEVFLPGWNQAYIDSIPTNRRIITPYTREETPVTVIDFYVASPNIRIESMKAIDLDFKNSDHHPVFITFSLN